LWFITQPPGQWHSLTGPEQERWTDSPLAHERLIIGAKVLAATVIDVLTNPDRIKTAFAEEAES
jgi:hypothetical protein